ncbi:MAG: transcriptional repressor LexA [Bacillota bacterium]|nr:transcriptional repressor LexA [Bacillota bacterium]
MDAGRPATSALRPRERQILETIDAFLREHGYPPSVREIGARVGLRSSSTVHAYLRELARKGYLRQEGSRPRALGLVGLAGLPATAGEAGRGLRRIPLLPKPPEPAAAAPLPLAWLVLPADAPGGRAAYALRVQGSAMEGAGIGDGDLVLCGPAAEASPGQLVVALVGDEPVVRRLLPEGDAVRLQAANPGVQPLVSREVRLVGRVLAVLHGLAGASGGGAPHALGAPPSPAQER